MIFPMSLNATGSNERKNQATGEKTLAFDYKKGDFIIEDGKCKVYSGIDAIRAWVEKVLKTEKFQFKIYDGEDYGVTIKDLVVGSNLPLAFIETELKREVIEALVKHPKINGISGFVLMRKNALLKVSFTVELDKTAYKQEVAL